MEALILLFRSLIMLSVSGVGLLLRGSVVLFAICLPVHGINNSFTKLLSSPTIYFSEILESVSENFCSLSWGWLVTGVQGGLSHCICSQRRRRTVEAGMQLAFSLLLDPGFQPVDWCHSTLARVFPPQLSQIKNFSMVSPGSKSRQCQMYCCLMAKLPAPSSRVMLQPREISPYHQDSLCLIF